jgi:ribosomal protein S18 acetylase RimI-like enzyme
MRFERNIERIATEGLTLDFSMVPWDTEIFGYPVGQIEAVRLEGAGDQGRAFREFSAWCEERAVRLVSCRLPSDRLRESMFLEDQGFRFVEMVYSPELPLRDAAPRHGDRLRITEAQQGDIPAIRAIAKAAFSTGRFLLDWRLDAEASHRRYGVWVENSFGNPQHCVLKAIIGEDIAGFFIVEEKPNGECYWHLTAVAPEWQGKGIGRELWESMAARHKAAGLSRIRTTISAHNAPVINVYARLGFRFGAPQVTLHWLRY